jgi:hypothetical protein
MGLFRPAKPLTGKVFSGLGEGLQKVPAAKMSL